MYDHIVHFKFPGQGQRDTPVADLRTLLEKPPAALPARHRSLQPAKPPVFVLGDGGGESALVVVSSPSSVFVSGDGGDVELGVKLFVAVVTVCFVSGDGGDLELGVKLFVVAVTVCFVSGDGGDLELGVKLFVAVVCFCFGRAGERVSFGVAVAVVCFCFGRAGERVSFGVAVAVVCFCFGGRWRGVGCETVRRRRLFLFRGTVAIWSWV